MKRVDFAALKVGDTIYLAEPRGWNTSRVSEWIVARKTPTGQVVAKRGEGEMRLTATGAIIGEGAWSRRQIVTAETAEKIRADAREEDRWNSVRVAAEALEKAARQQDHSAAVVALRQAAQAIEARSGETGTGSTEGESAVPAGDAPESGHRARGE